MKQAIINALIRTARTFVQSFLAVWIAGAAGAVTFGTIANSALLEQAAVAGIVAAGTLVWNLIESGLGEPIPKG